MTMNRTQPAYDAHLDFRVRKLESLSANPSGGGIGASYTPTLSPTLNVTSVTVQRASYTQIGDVVTVSIGFAINITAAGADTLFSLTLPVPRLNGNIYWGTGTVAFTSSPMVMTPCFFQTSAVVGGTTGNVYIRSVSSGNQSGAVTFQYTIA